MPKTATGNKYLVVFIDYLTKWPEVFVTKDQTAQTIARLLVERVIPQHGVPRELLSDRGANFLSKLVAEVCRLVGTKKINTSTYHPQTDGLVERFHRTLLDMLSKKTGYHKEIRDRMSLAWEMARKNIVTAQNKQKRLYDVRTKPTEFRKGDVVFIFQPAKRTGGRRKINRPNEGPFGILDIWDTGALVLKEGKKDAKRVSLDRLRKCPREVIDEAGAATSCWSGRLRSRRGRRSLEGRDVTPGRQGQRSDVARR